MDENPRPRDLDVVIATRDRPGPLAACLDSLAGQTLDSFGVIVVDDGSREPIAEVVSAYPPGGAPPVLVRNHASAGAAASRNRGVEASTAPYIVFVDDDVIAHPDLLSAHRSAFERNPGPAVSIGALLPPEGARLQPWDMWQADRIARAQAAMERGEAPVSWEHLYTGNVGLRRADFDAVGGFETGLVRQEDMELGYRLSELGCTFVFDPRALAWHDVHHSVEEWLLLAAQNARHDVLFDQLHPDGGRMRTVREEFDGRTWAMRALRRACGRLGISRAVERLAIATGAALYRMRLDRPALLACAVVWDLAYHRALAEAEPT